MDSSKHERPQFLTVKDVAKMFAVKPRTIYSWVARAEETGLPVERIGGLLRFRLDRLLEWADSQSSNSRTAPRTKNK